MKILLVEDERKIANLIALGLQSEGHIVNIAYDGNQAKKLVETEDFDLVILDVMLPGSDGFSVCRHIRSLNLKWPILMLTACTDVLDTIHGLDVGADDYLKKPFNFRELCARVRALSRREDLVHLPIIKHGSISFNQNNREIMIEGRKLDLSQKEYQLLDFLLRHECQLCTKTIIGEHLWGVNYKYSDKENHVISTMISSLRKKISKLSKKGEGLIKTVSGAGYKLS